MLPARWGWMTAVKRKVFVRQANRTAEVPVEVFLNRDS